MVGAEAYKYWYGATDRNSPRLSFSSGRPRSRAGSIAAELVDRRRGQS